MRTKLLLILVSLFSTFPGVKAEEADIIDVVASYFNTGDAAKLSEYFSSTVELDILSEENVYSKAQAEQIMRNFFSKNKPLSLKIIHRINSNENYKLAVFSMSTAREKFRVSVSMSSNGGRFLIKEIRIEQDKQ